MKIKNKSKKPLIFLGILAVIVAGSVLAYFFVYNSQSQIASRDTDNSTPKRSESDVQQSEHLDESPDSKTETPNTDQPAPTTPSTTPNKEKVSMTASTDSSNSTIYIRGGVNYPVPASGSCFAQLKGPSGQSVRKDTTLLQNPSSTDCKTISIPAGELAAGTWSFTLNYLSDTYEGVSNEVQFVVN